jgi:hypothetical protein
MPADGRSARANQQVKVIVEQAVTEQLERIALFELRQRLQEGLEIRLFTKHFLAVVAAVDDMVDQAAVNGSQRAWHSAKIADCGSTVDKIVLTRFKTRVVFYSADSDSFSFACSIIRRGHVNWKTPSGS